MEVVKVLIFIQLLIILLNTILGMTFLRGLKRIGNPFGQVSFANKITRKKIGRVLSKTFYQELTSAHAPFNWRIASALAISQLSRKDIDKFLTALDKVLITERDAVYKFDGVEESRLKTILNPFQKKGTVSEIEQRLIDFKSYSAPNPPNPIRTFFEKVDFTLSLIRSTASFPAFISTPANL